MMVFMPRDDRTLYVYQFYRTYHGRIQISSIPLYKTYTTPSSLEVLRVKDTSNIALGDSLQRQGSN